MLNIGIEFGDKLMAAQLICAFVFAFAKSRFFHDVAHVSNYCT